ncbi:hypothetical protein KIPB_012229 [Kipferlia bialata]|uniref:Pentapeptide repeat-containing protein n=1 Tax=Kipferlia bialata TaxID=797122 RepID=A0A9K3D5V7_9EUKA|nr:hypothetical protein KIPB_012229 [Kipferlia bialata]|eukprot:g12229.t1
MCKTILNDIQCEGVVLEGACLDSVSGLTEGVLRGAKSLRGGHFVNCGMRAFNLSGLDMTGVRLQGCKMAECMLDGACLQKSRVLKCDLAKACAVSTDFSESVMRNTRLYNVDFATAVLTEADWDSISNNGFSSPLHASLIQGARLPVATQPYWPIVSVCPSLMVTGTSRSRYNKTQSCHVPWIQGLRWFIDIVGVSAVAVAERTVYLTDDHRTLSFLRTSERIEVHHPSGDFSYPMGPCLSSLCLTALPQPNDPEEYTMTIRMDTETEKE